MKATLRPCRDENRPEAKCYDPISCGSVNEIAGMKVIISNAARIAR